LYDGLTNQIEHSFYSNYEFYLKQFDFELQYSINSPYKNWIFTFDTSYFFTNFKSWDFFEFNLKSLRPKSFNLTNTTFNSEQLNIFFSNFDMLA
jgi:hypothetical protein